LISVLDQEEEESRLAVCSTRDFHQSQTTTTTKERGWDGIGDGTNLEVETSCSQGSAGGARPTKDLVDEGAKRNRVVRIGPRVGGGGGDGRSERCKGRRRGRPYGEEEFESGVFF